MLIAEKTLKNNIAEHVIYMFQIEGLIRANNLDKDVLINSLIKPQISDESLLAKYDQWYSKLIAQMKREGLEKSGHLSEINEILMELLMLHNTLLNIINDKKYKLAFEKALPALKDFQAKSNSSNINLIEIGFNALYSKIILKLKGQEISEATDQAFNTIAELLAYLAAYYKKMKEGDLNFPNN